MDKIKLRLCAGTMCYVMGGAQLMEIEELLSEEEKQGIEITFSPCLQRCNGKDTPPFAELNGEIITGVSKETLLRINNSRLVSIAKLSYNMS